MVSAEFCAIYVHIGENLSLNLISNANCFKFYNPHVEQFLITDNPSNWINFPGNVIELDSAVIDIMNKTNKFKYRDKFTVAGGYWFYSLARIFALKQIGPFVSENTSIYHLESDVQFYINSDLNKLILDLNIDAACCSYRENKGIGSVLYFRNGRVLDSKLNEMFQILKNSKKWISDMELLDSCLEKGVLSSLPYKINDTSIQINRNNFIFDPAYVGQYLFGQDPVHQGNKLVGGYISPYFQIDLMSSVWGIDDPFTNGKQMLYVLINGEKNYFLNLHLHSKIDLTPPSLNSSIWRRTIQAANREIAFPILSKNVTDYVYTNNGDLFGRIIRRMREYYNRYFL